MTTRFYLRPCSPKEITKHSFREDTLIHKSTQLHVKTDATGFHVSIHEDPYEYPGFEPRRDLVEITTQFSCRILVCEQTYLEDIPVGAYACGDEKTTIQVGVKGSDLHNRNSYFRVVMITAPTWEQMKSAIAKIKIGAIMPVGSEQTLLESLCEKLEQAKNTIAEYEKFIDYSAGYLGNALPTRTPDALESLRKRVITAGDATFELACIKSSWWYRLGVMLGRPLAPLPHDRRASRG